MKKIIIITITLCLLSTNVLGGIAYENLHEKENDIHGLLHELGQPHSHYHDDNYDYELSYTSDAFEHIQSDTDCCVLGLINVSLTQVICKNMSGIIVLCSSHWVSPHLQHIKPPPRYSYI